jgi:hypothetical protein
MGVDCDRSCSCEGVQDDIGAFSADAGQLHQCGTALRNRAAEPFQQESRGGHEMAGFRPEEPETAQVAGQGLRTEREQGFGILCHREQGGGGPVHGLVGRLCRQEDRDQKLEGGSIVEFGGGRRILPGEAPEQGAHLAG